MRFSRLLTVFCAVAVTSCAYIIPPEQNVPRSNSVVGEPHRPVLNNRSSGPRSAVTPRPEMPQPTPVVRNELPELPPVDAATQAQAEQELANAAPSAAAPATMPAPAVVTGDRRVPLENQQFQMASSSYPSLNSVPPRPQLSGPDSAKERLSAVQTDLEQDRAQAAESKETLARDAAAEPSLLSELPPTQPTVPAADPVAVTPVLPEMNAAPAVQVPVRESIRTLPVPAVKPQSAAPAPAAPLAAVKPITSPAPMNSEPAQAGLTFRPVAVPTSASSPVAVPAIESYASGDTFTIAQPRTLTAAKTKAAAPAPVAPATLSVTEAPAPIAAYTPVATTPNVPNFAPPAPLNAASTPAPKLAAVAPLPEQVAMMPAKTQPIILARPVETVPVITTQELQAPAAPAYAAAQASPNTAAVRPTVKRGDFDPLAAADNAPIAAPVAATTSYSAPASYASSGYLAGSRYADRRN